MATQSDNFPARTAPSDPSQTALADVVNSLGDKLSAALAHTSRSKELESRRQIERVLGRHLEPRFAYELLTLLLAPGNEGRELRAAFAKLLTMTESAEWAEASTRGSPAIINFDDEAKFLASEEATCVQEMARCGECVARMAEEREGESLTRGQAANLQWAVCAQCRSGTAAWFQS